mgnify:CR=1 FL=1
MWQDWLMAILSLIFVVGLLPTLLCTEKPHRSSCIVYAAGLTLYGVAYASLGMWLATVTTVLGAAMWWILLVQRRTHGQS